MVNMTQKGATKNGNGIDPAKLAISEGLVVRYESMLEMIAGPID